MKGGKRPLGYTIIEVMVVLAVSGVMFLIAATFISGKQESTAFLAGSNELGSRLQGVIDDISDGHYSDVPINCSVTATGLSFIGSAKGQGANSDCVFLGKVVHFYASGSANPENYETFSLADARVDPLQHLPVTGLPNQWVQAIDSLTTTASVPQSLDIKYLKVYDSAGAPLESSTNPATDGFNIGFILGLGQTGIVSGNTVYQSGAQTVAMVYDSSITITSAAQANVTAVAGNSIVPAQSVSICVTDSTRSALIQIGTNDASGTGSTGNQLNVNVKQLGKAPCS